MSNRQPGCRRAQGSWPSNLPWVVLAAVSSWQGQYEGLDPLWWHLCCPSAEGMDPLWQHLCCPSARPVTGFLQGTSGQGPFTRSLLWPQAGCSQDAPHRALPGLGSGPRAPVAWAQAHCEAAPLFCSRWGSRGSGRSDDLPKVMWLRQQTRDLNPGILEPCLCPNHASGGSHLAIVTLEPVLRGGSSQDGPLCCPRSSDFPREGRQPASWAGSDVAQASPVGPKRREEEAQRCRKFTHISENCCVDTYLHFFLPLTLAHAAAQEPAGGAGPMPGTLRVLRLSDPPRRQHQLRAQGLAQVLSTVATPCAARG